MTPLPPEEEAAPSPGIVHPKRREPAKPRDTRRSLDALHSASQDAKAIVTAVDTDGQGKDDGLDSIGHLHPKIRAWITEHKREQKEREQENRRRRRDVWSWSRPLLDELTARDLYRFRASSTLCHAIEKAGGRVKDANLHGKLIFTVQGRDIECVVKEKMSRPVKRLEGEAAKWTAYPHHHNSGLTSSGFLRAQITTWLPGEQPQWVESQRKPFSALIPPIVETVLASVPRLVEGEEQREEERRRYQEEERRRWELRRRKEIDDNRWNRFRAAAKNWREKQILDSFTAELEARLASEGDRAIGGKTASEWMSWAKARAAELDPFADGVAGLFQNVIQS